MKLVAIFNIHEIVGTVLTDEKKIQYVKGSNSLNFLYAQALLL